MPYRQGQTGSKSGPHELRNRLVGHDERPDVHVGLAISSDWSRWFKSRADAVNTDRSLRGGGVIRYAWASVRTDSVYSFAPLLGGLRQSADFLPSPGDDFRNGPSTREHDARERSLFKGHHHER